MGSKIIYDNLGALVLHMDIAPFEVLVAMSLVAVIRSKVAHTLITEQGGIVHKPLHNKKTDQFLIGVW